MDSSRTDLMDVTQEENASVINTTEFIETEEEPWKNGVEFVQLSEHVLRSLDINTGKGSLYHLLNKCCTPQGSRLLLQWIARPLRDVNEIENRLNLVEYFVKKPSVRLTIADMHLKKFPDFGPIIRKLEKKTATLQEMYRTYLAIQKLPALVAALQSDREGVGGTTVLLMEERFLMPLKKAFADFSDFQELIRETVDFDFLLTTGDYRIKPTLIPALQELDEQLGSFKEQMDEDWESLCRETRLPKEKTLKLELDSRLGYLYRVTRKDERLLRQANLNIETVDTKTAGYRFRTSKLAELNREYLQILSKYHKCQEQVIEELVSTACTYSVPLRSLSEVLAPLDVIVALAFTAFSAQYVRPTILPQDTGIIELIESRHPCIESFSGRDFIPNSAKFEQKKATFHIVTGPNMGGKSTYIRQVALTVIMAQIGSFVPCKSAKVSLIDGVYTRIGAGDSVAKGVSTFMMEMLEIQEILKHATKYSLIIIDELGRGTSTYDGYGLAYAVSESIAKDLGAYCMLTTHFNELADLKNTCENIVLSHVTALVRQEDITFQYVVVPGVCSQSFGVNVAQMAGLPAPVLEDAKEILQELENAHQLGTAAAAGVC